MDWIFSDAVHLVDLMGSRVGGRVPGLLWRENNQKSIEWTLGPSC